MLPIENAVPRRYPPVVTWALIAANCLVFFIQLSLGPTELERFLARYALIPARYFAPPPFGGADPTLGDYLPFVSNMFLHGGWLHLILNMWTLWMFGPTVEDRAGPLRYIVFYLAAGILASVTHALFNQTSAIPALGASGAIAGVLGCYIRLFPFARLVVVIPILFFPFFFEMPAIVFSGLWFLMQVLQGTVELFTPSDGGGVAWWAHIGGFVGGLLLTPILRRPRRQYRAYYADEGVLGFNTQGYR
jgi:membrane associated rhomboid family serine protease